VRKGEEHSTFKNCGRKDNANRSRIEGGESRIPGRDNELMLNFWGKGRGGRRRGGGCVLTLGIE